MSQSFSKIQEEIDDVTSFISANNYQYPFLKNESPDFRIIHKNRTIGIEHQRLFQPADSDGVRIQNQESLKDQIFSKAEFIYNKKDGSNAIVFVNFKDVYGRNIDKNKYRLSKRDVDKIAQQISSKVYKQNDPSKKKILLNRSSLKDIDSRIESMTIWNNKQYRSTIFDRAKGGLIPKIEVGFLQEKILKKESRVDDYYEKCDDIWLLLVVNPLTFERSFDLSDPSEFTTADYRSSFDSIFIFTKNTWSTYKLK